MNSSWDRTYKRLHSPNGLRENKIHSLSDAPKRHQTTDSLDSYRFSSNLILNESIHRFHIETIRNEMQKIMTANVGVFRTNETLSAAKKLLIELKEQSQTMTIDDKGKLFNNDLLEAWELGCLLELAQATTESALARTESRGAHARDDFPERDDDNWLTHTLCFKDREKYQLEYKAVTLGRYEPKARVY